MATFKISRVTALPSTLAADTIYLVATSATTVEMYVTGNNAVARRMLNEDDVQTMINASVASLSTLEIVANIAARNALIPANNIIVLVTDATGDPTVASGAATYAYKFSTGVYTKISEYESMDVTLSWANITGKPTSTVVQIDAAVANSHTHANLTQLSQIGQSASGDITYNGREYVRSGDTTW